MTYIYFVFFVDYVIQHVVSQFKNINKYAYISVDGDCPRTLQVTGFGETADGEYTLSDQLNDRWPYYKHSVSDVGYCISHNEIDSNWWLQNTCNSLGVNKGIARGVGYSYCPSECVHNDEGKTEKHSKILKVKNNNDF